MGVDAGITGRSSQVLILTVRDVEVSLGIAVFLGQTEIDHVNLISTLTNSHQEVIGFDVTMDERFGVDIFDAGDQLIGQEKNGLQRKFAVAKIEQVLQTGAEEVDDHRVVVTFSTEPTDEGDADTPSEGFVDAGFIFELWVLSLDAFELDSDLLAGDNVGA